MLYIKFEVKRKYFVSIGKRGAKERSLKLGKHNTELVFLNIHSSAIDAEGIGVLIYVWHYQKLM